MLETLELHENTPLPQGTLRAGTLRLRGRTNLLRQVLRFGLVGGLNTLVDLLILNGLLLLFSTGSTLMLLVYSAVAYSIGAVNSFLLNKYWTFGQRQRTTRKELLRFALTTLCGIGWSSIILWLASNLLHPFLVNATVWANASKVLAIGGTALISYLGMRLWVFVIKVQQEQTLSQAIVSVSNEHQSTSVTPQRGILTKINAELLYKLTRSGCSYREIGVHHHPRLGGRATGAKPGVILRALRELFVSACRWQQEEQMREVKTFSRSDRKGHPTILESRRPPRIW